MKKDFLKHVPIDIWLEIGSHCDLETLFKLATTCQFFMQLYIPYLRKIKQIQDKYYNQQERKRKETITANVNFDALGDGGHLGQQGTGTGAGGGIGNMLDSLLGGGGTTGGLMGMLSGGLMQGVRNSVLSFGISVKENEKTRIDFYKIFHKYLHKNFNPKYIPFFKELDVVIKSWEELGMYSKKQLDIIYKNKLYNLNSIVSNIYKVEFQLIQDIKDQLYNLPPKLLYLIWCRCFKNVKNKENVNESFKKFLSTATFMVFDHFKDNLVINQKFLLLCFQHKLDNVLIFLLKNPKFFYIDLGKSKSLADNIIFLACETDHLTLLLNPVLLEYLAKHHIKYAMIHGSNEFLISLWKSRRLLQLDLYDIVVNQLAFDPQLRGAKQQEFIKTCKRFLEKSV